MSASEQEEKNPWPPTPSWGYAAFTVAAMLLAVFLVWLSNWLEVRQIRLNATPSSQTSATTTDRNP
jgi:hypothetical protein